MNSARRPARRNPAATGSGRCCLARLAGRAFAAGQDEGRDQPGRPPTSARRGPGLDDLAAIFMPADLPGLHRGCSPVQPCQSDRQTPQASTFSTTPSSGRRDRRPPRSPDRRCSPSGPPPASPDPPPSVTRSTASVHVVKPCVTRLHPRRCRLRIFCENSSISPPEPRFFVEKSSAQTISTR